MQLVYLYNHPTGIVILLLTGTPFLLHRVGQRQFRFRHLISNGFIAKIELRDFGLLLEGKKIQIVIYLKRRELAQKWNEDFCIF